MSPKYKITTILFMLLLSGPVLFAQKDKVDWKDDIITINGQPFAKMTRKLVGLGVYDFAVSGSTGPELIYFKYVFGRWVYNNAAHRDQQVADYEVNFISTGSKATIPYHGADGIAKIVVENKLIVNNALDPEAERRFIQLFNGYYPATTPVPQPASPAVVVNVNNAPATGNPAEANAQQKSKSPVILQGNEITRDGSTIGKFREEVTASAFSVKTRVVTVYNADGEKVAEAFAPIDQPQEWQIRIMSDGRELSLLYDSPTELESLFKWMADKGHLRN